jgi:glycosyltransferase involved in cell wall biosynthesis
MAAAVGQFEAQAAVAARISFMKILVSAIACNPYSGSEGLVPENMHFARIAIETPEQMAQDIADAVTRFYNDRPLLAQMGAAAIRRIAENYSQENFNNRIRVLYQAALAAQALVH